MASTKVAKKKAGATPKEPRVGFFGRRGFLFYRHFRREFAAALVRERGYDWFGAREAANDLTNEEIDKKADKVGIIKKLGDGSFLQWLIDHGPQIMQLIQMFLAIFAMKGSEHVEKMTMKFSPSAMKAKMANKEDKPDPFEDEDEEEEE